MISFFSPTHKTEIRRRDYIVACFAIAFRLNIHILNRVMSNASEGELGVTCELVECPCPIPVQIVSKISVCSNCENKVLACLVLTLSIPTVLSPKLINFPKLQSEEN